MTISIERSVKAYCLMHETETMNKDLGYHAQVVPFEGYEEVSISMNKPLAPVAMAAFAMVPIIWGLPPVTPEV